MLRQQAAVADLPNSAQFSPPAFPRRERLQQKQFQKKKKTQRITTEKPIMRWMSPDIVHTKRFFFFFSSRQTQRVTFSNR
jgi:hypothetical protein